MRICRRCSQETEETFCPTCKVLTSVRRDLRSPSASARGDVFDCIIWQGPSRSRGIEVPVEHREKYFSKDHELIVLDLEGTRTIAKLSAGFWKKPAVIKRAIGDDGKDHLYKFISKHHLLTPDQSLKEKGIVDTVTFTVVTPGEEFKVSVAERSAEGGERE
ncbi:MAG: hypothetical protein JSV90_09290 [Methanobacteriota archaeon]|nr:MAG: hypothetical protein JSV90_09290 [Euryarchaeota archaeon]